MNAILIDDEIHSLNILRSDLARHCPEVKVIHQFDDSREALRWLRSHPVDLVFLDIQMPHLSGIELLEALRPLRFHVVFITAFSQYAVKAFRLSAVDFLEKPVDPDELKEAVSRVKKLTNQQPNEGQLGALSHNLRSDAQKPNHQKIALPGQRGLDFIPLHEILYFESDGNFSWVHLFNGRKNFVSRSLKKIESLLEQHPFYRIHHQFLINLEQLVRYEKADSRVILADGRQLPVARDKKGGFGERLGE